MNEGTFDLASFYATVGATSKERPPLRQDLVRGLKDYFEAVYGYDRYGAETILHVGERLGQAFIFGYCSLRILRDRRISDETKVAVAERGLDVIEYGGDSGLPYGLFEIVGFLFQRSRLDSDDLRYALVASAGEYNPFAGVEKRQFLQFFRSLMSEPSLPPVERLFWGHSLVARHQDLPGASELIRILLDGDQQRQEHLMELCQAWVNFRQPRLAIDVPTAHGGYRSNFVADHMGFWIAHAPSWSSAAMLKSGVVQLAKMSHDPMEIARTYLAYTGTYIEHAQAAVVDVIAARYRTVPQSDVKDLIESGIANVASIPIRRRFYQLGRDIFGQEYLERASNDSSSSVRHWAARQLEI